MTDSTKIADNNHYSHAEFWFENAKINFSGKKGYFSGYKTDTNSSYIRWELHNNVVIAETDFFGFYPLYYKFENNILSLSDNIVGLVKENEPLNYSALSVFLRTGDFVGTDTPFKNIVALSGNSRLVYDGARLELMEKSDKKPRSTFQGSDIDFAKEYGKRFKQSIRQLLEVVGKDTFIMPLSGGRDSRHILFELKKQNRSPERCITIKHQPPKSNEDFRIAKTLCDRLGISHTGLEQNLSLLNAERTKNKLTSFSALEHSWFLPLMDYVKNNHEKFVFDGIGGDVFVDSVKLTEERLRWSKEGDWQSLAEDILGSEGYFDVLFDSEHQKLMSRDKAIKHLVVHLEKYQDYPNPIKEFFFWNRTPRTIGPSAFGMLGRVATTLAPFLDESLYNLVSSMPAERFLGKDRVYFRDVIFSELYPQWNDIPFESKVGEPNSESTFQRLTENLEFMKFYMFNQSKIIKKKEVLVRIIKRIFNKRFHEHSKVLIQVPLYIRQLEELVSANVIPPENRSSFK